MTGGRGICHSEVSTPGTEVLHGVQLWVALPDHARDAPRDLQHHVRTPRGRGRAVRVFLGTLLGETSPVRTFTPLLGAELTLDPGAAVTLDVDPSFEHGVLADSGGLSLEGTELGRAELAFIGPGPTTLTLANDHDEPARLLLGAPLRGGHPHVVESRGPQLRGDRAVPRGLAGRDGASAASRATRTGSGCRPFVRRTRIRPRQNPAPPTTPPA